MEELLSFEGASLGYRGEPVLEVPELRLSQGNIAILRGPSGSGKSTLLRCAAGLQRAISGVVRYRGSRIAWVPQADRLDALHPVSVEEVALAGAARRTSPRYLSPFGRVTTEGRAALTGALESIGLGGFSRRPFAELSGGQRQRVLVARAILSGADLVVLDEPTSALDDEAAAQVSAAVRRLAQDGAAVLIASHDQAGEWGGDARTFEVQRGTLREARER